MSGKYIIGAGITGLVWKYYHPEFQIISPDVGGAYARSHLVWLHDTQETRKLLTDLGLPIHPKKSSIGYYHKGWITDSIPPDMNLSMIQKKMTPWNLPVDKSFVPKTTDLSLASGELMMSNYMKTLDVDLVEVIKRLNQNADVINGLVTQITKNEIAVKTSPKDEGRVFGYEKLISTIAAPFFWKAWGTPKEFKCLPITNIITKNRPSIFDDRYEMVYYDDSVPFSRVSHLDGVYAIEFTGVIEQDEFEKLYPSLKVEDYFMVNQGRIFENTENVSPIEPIIFSGRFAQWKYGITSEHVIAQAINYKK